MQPPSSYCGQVSKGRRFASGDLKRENKPVRSPKPDVLKSSSTYVPTSILTSGKKLDPANLCYSGSKSVSFAGTSGNVSPRLVKSLPVLRISPVPSYRVDPTPCRARQI
eukprot:GEMP01100869.1.p1 GENE.GEMP01100869.1~~GEMP01100869.1.p1  ORF type:complete len:109 (+),score=8.18 GEMP01100869.1:68-394(+)